MGKSVLRIVQRVLWLGVFAAWLNVGACTATDGCCEGYVVNARVLGSPNGTVYLVGYEDNRGFLKKNEGEAWHTLFEEGEHPLVDVWIVNEDELFAAGATGCVIHCKGQSCVDLSDNLRNDVGDGEWIKESLVGIWASGADDVFAVGQDGAVLHFNGAKWTREPVPTTTFLRKVWGASSDNVTIVGDEGTIIHYDGSQYTEMDSGTDKDLRGIWGFGPSDIYAVGGSELDGSYIILHYDGNEWVKVKSGEPFNLIGVHGSSSSNIYAVGGVRKGDSVDGVILRYDGETWSEVNHQVKNFIWSVWTPQDGEFFAVGSGGVLLHVKP